MRLCERNKKTLYYATQFATQEVEDEWGNLTGEIKTLYTTPVEIKANISPSKGSASTEMFGEDLNYTKTVIVEDINCHIDEYSRLWVDNLDITRPHDYVVVGVAKSLTNIAYAIKKVDVNGL